MPTDVAVDLSALTLSPWTVLLRLGCAMLIGAVVGTEREYTHRPAGMRTHMLVAIGACAVMTTSQMIFAQYRAYGATPDPARLSAQVITGMGFLGAGTIMKEGVTIKGLTTAASIWATACMGIAVGGGYYSVALIGAAFMMITLVVFEGLQEKMMRNHYELYQFTVHCTNLTDTLERVNHLSEEFTAKITHIQVEGKEGKVIVIFKADFSGRGAKERLNMFVAALEHGDSTLSLEMSRSRI